MLCHPVGGEIVFAGFGFGLFLGEGERTKRCKSAVEGDMDKTTWLFLRKTEGEGAEGSLGGVVKRAGGAILDGGARTDAGRESGLE